MELTKATIEILDSALHGRMPRTIQVQLNPNELRLSKDVDFAEVHIPGLDAPFLQFIKGSSETLEIELFCDTTKSGMGEDVEDVRTFTEPIRELARVQPETHAPPRIRFRWGEGISFDAVVTRVEQTFSLFNPHGIPLRATLRLFLKEYGTLGRVVLRRQLQPAKSASSETGGSPAGDRYVPVIEIRARGQRFDAVAAGDVLKVIASDRLGSGESFELTINNWDDERRDFKYSDIPLLEPGKRIEIDIGYRDQKQRFTVGGTIGSVRQLLLGGGRPTLIVSGGTARRGRKKSGTKRTRKPAVRLAYGESLIEFERQRTLAKKATRTTKRSLPRRADLLTAAGVSIGLPDLRADSNIELQGLGSGFTGTYYVTAVTHTLDSDGYRTSFECREEKD